MQQPYSGHSAEALTSLIHSVQIHNKVKIGMQVLCVAGLQILVYVLFVAVLIASILLNNFLLFV